MFAASTRARSYCWLLLLAGNLAAYSGSWKQVDAFHVVAQPPPTRRSAKMTTSSSQLFSLLSLERTAAREVDQFQEWAFNQVGVQSSDGFCLLEQNVDGNEDFYAATSTEVEAGSPLLYVPGEAILSASSIAAEMQGYIEPSLQLLEHLPTIQQQHFYLFVKILLEYENGADAPCYPWLAALPRKWNTAASMDDFCLSCLPPFLKTLCTAQRDEFTTFAEAVQAFEYLSAESKANSKLLQYAYNVVATRSSLTDTGDLQIIPVVDMFNHGFPANAALVFNDEEDGNSGSYQVVAVDHVAAGEALTLDYGEPANQPRFLAKYGFLNDAPATYCKLLINNPSPELREIGYSDPSRTLLFDTQTGEIFPAVWDVVLYSRLERKPQHEEAMRAFYQAHVSGDEATKAAIHQEFFGETRSAIQRHVDNILSEVAELRVKTNAFDSSKHPRLPLLRRHNDLVFSVFQKVRQNLVAMAQ